MSEEVRLGEDEVNGALVQHVLDDWVTHARTALGEELVSVVLFGSAADGQLRRSSDVNMVMLLRNFDAQALAGLREALRSAHAAIRLEIMFLLERELPAATVAFAVKFADIRQRHRVLFGKDPFADLRVPREAELARLKQVLLNATLRLRQRYMLSSLREEQATRAVAESAGPLRACAEALCELRGAPAATPKLALETLMHEAGPSFAALPEAISEARERLSLPPGTAASTLLLLIQLTEQLSAVTERLETPA